MTYQSESTHVFWFLICSADIIRSAVFGKDENGDMKERFEFPSNKLVITNIDIQVFVMTSLVLLFASH